MTGVRPADLIRRLETPTLADRALLARFVMERDQSAFAEIVSRYGPLVIGVCRRVTGHRQDAEDAFQAVFLVLARKASTIRKPEVLGTWLHGVALRVAQTVRRSVLRRRTREDGVSVMPEPAAAAPSIDDDTGRLLHEELEALPAWYREAIVSCDLRGLSRPEAAALLGVPEGTLSSRLAAGRKKLGERLARRGVTLPAAMLATALTTAQASVAVSGELFAQTCKLVAEALAGAAIPRPLAKLVNEEMAVRKVLLIAVLASVTAIAGVVYAGLPGEGTPPEDQPPAVVARPKEKAKPAPAVATEDKPVEYAKTPFMTRAFDIGLVPRVSLKIRWSRQGTLLAIAGSTREVSQPAQVDEFGFAAQFGGGGGLPGGGGGGFPASGAAPIGGVLHHALRIAGPDSVLFTTDHRGDSELVGFSPDGEQVITVLHEYNLVSGLPQLEFWDLKKKPKPQANPSHIVIDRIVRLEPTFSVDYAFAPDGKTFRTVAVERDRATREVRKATVLEVDATTGKPIKTLVSAEANAFDLSSDGKRFAVMTSKDADNNVSVYDVDRGAKISSYTMPADNKRVNEKEEKRPTRKGGILGQGRERNPGLLFSPDAKRLLVYGGLGALNNYGNSMCELMSGPAGRAVVLNVDTGKPLPALEDAGFLEIFPERGTFSSDGRLLALSGTHYDPANPDQNRRRFQGVVLVGQRTFTTVWDTETGKVLKTWDAATTVAFNPVRPVLAVVEPNGQTQSRLGYWDFSAEAAKK